jgi:hypothetical protein
MNRNAVPIFIKYGSIAMKLRCINPNVNNNGPIAATKPAIATATDLHDSGRFVQRLQCGREHFNKRNKRDRNDFTNGNH